MSKRVRCYSAFDPSGYAGSRMDQRAVESFAVHCDSVLTAVTAQNGSRMYSMDCLGAEQIAKQAELLARPQAIKLGALGNEAIVRAVARSIDDTNAPVITDGVLQSSSGMDLLLPRARAAFIKEIIPRSDLLTVNAVEAATLTGICDDYPAAAKSLLEMGCQAVLVKDGHGSGDYCRDYYLDQAGSFWIRTPRIEGASVRGTGCALASAIAAAFTQLGVLREAVIVGTAYVQRGIRLGNPQLWHGPWPVESQDFPCITASIEQHQFRSCPPVGFYPVVPSVTWVENVCLWGVESLQLRIKRRPEGLEEQVQQAIRLAVGRRLFINDHWDLAIKNGAYGVHLGQEDLLDADWGLLKASQIRLGVSTHSYEELARALAYGPSYIALGPIFPTTTKEMPWEPQGMERIGIWKQLIDCPLVAIGGLDLERSREARAAGADGIACVRDITDHHHPEQRVEAWLRHYPYAKSSVTLGSST